MGKREIKLELINGAFDIVIEDGDFANEEGLDTNIWVSLFSDSRATVSQVIAPENRRGWMGDLVAEVPERLLGSYLWLVEQRRLNQDTLNEVIDYIRKALEWLVTDGLALKVEVSGSIIPRLGIDATATITSTDGTTSNHYIELWRLTGAN